MLNFRIPSAAVAVALISGAASAECIFSPDPNYGGGDWTLQNNDRVHWYEEGSQDHFAETDAASGWTGRIFYDHTSGANDRMSSVRVVGSCEAVLYEDPNGNGKVFRTSVDVPDLASSGLNDLASMADCVCSG